MAAQTFARTIKHSLQRPHLRATQRRMSSTRPPAYADWLKWCTSTEAPREEVEYFKTVPWTKALIDNGSFRPAPTPSRLSEPGSSESNFFAKTIKSHGTIDNWLLLMKKGLRPPAQGPKGSIPRNAGSGDSIPSRSAVDADCLLLLNLGEQLDGFPGVAHGGSLCAVLDEMLSLVVEFHRQSATDDRGALFTVRLTTTFRGPVPTPGQVMVKAWLEAWEGRKWLLKGQICDKDENVLTEGEGIWVSARTEKM